MKLYINLHIDLYIESISYIKIDIDTLHILNTIKKFIN